MKSYDAGLLAILSGGNKFFVADLVTVVLKDGTTYNWTGAHIDVTAGGVTYSSSGPGVECGRYRQESELTVDTFDITLQCGDALLVGGLPLPDRALSGMFRRARVTSRRTFVADVGDAWPVPLAVFEGHVSDVEATSTSVLLRCASETETLAAQTIPRTLVTSQCQNTLYDSLCGLTKASWTLTGTVQSSPTPTTTVFKTSATARADPQGGYAWSTSSGPDRGFFGFGIVTFTSGALSGLRRVVEYSGNTSGTKQELHLLTPLPSAPAAGVSHSIILGCDLSKADCYYKFSSGGEGNWANFRGFHLMQGSR